MYGALYNPGEVVSLGCMLLAVHVGKGRCVLKSVQLSTQEFGPTALLNPDTPPPTHPPSHTDTQTRTDRHIHPHTHIPTHPCTHQQCLIRS